MEEYEQMIRATRRWLGEADKLVSEVTQQQLARLKAWEQVLTDITLKDETGTHNETYERVCIIFIDNIVLSTRTALISREIHNVIQGKSNFPEILQPKIEEMEAYLKMLAGKNEEIDRVIDEIEKKVSYLL